MPKYLFSNRASATLASAITATATSITLSSGQGSMFPAPGANEAFHATIIDVNGNSEIVRCTARSGDVLTVVRGVEGTTPRAFAAGSRIELRLTAEVVSSFVQGAFLPTLAANLDFGGFAPVNVNWSIVHINAASLQVNSVPVVTQTRQITVGPGLSGGGSLDNDVSINLRFATNEEAQNPSITDRVISPANLSMFTSPAFTWVAPLTSTATVYSYVHNLDRYPVVEVMLRCRVANNGYQVGDLVSITSMRKGDAAVMPVVIVSTTVVEVIMPSNLKFSSRSNPGDLIEVVPNNWEIYARGWRF